MNINSRNGQKWPSAGNDLPAPMMVKANHVKVCDGQAFICQSGYGGNDYAPDHLFDDDENCTEDIKDMCFDEEGY